MMQVLDSLQDKNNIQLGDGATIALIEKIYPFWKSKLKAKPKNK